MNVKELKIHMLRGLMRPEYFYIPVISKKEEIIPIRFKLSDDLGNDVYTTQISLSYNPYSLFHDLYQDESGQWISDHDSGYKGYAFSNDYEWRFPVPNPSAFEIYPIPDFANAGITATDGEIQISGTSVTVVFNEPQTLIEIKNLPAGVYGVSLPTSYVTDENGNSLSLSGVNYYPDYYSGEYSDTEHPLYSGNSYGMVDRSGEFSGFYMYQLSGQYGQPTGYNFYGISKKFKNNAMPIVAEIKHKVRIVAKWMDIPYYTNTTFICKDNDKTLTNRYWDGFKDNTNYPGCSWVIKTNKNVTAGQKIGFEIYIDDVYKCCVSSEISMTYSKTYSLEPLTYNPNNSVKEWKQKVDEGVNISPNLASYTANNKNSIEITDHKGSHKVGGPSPEEYADNSAYVGLKNNPPYSYTEYRYYFGETEVISVEAATCGAFEQNITCEIKNSKMIDIGRRYVSCTCDQLTTYKGIISDVISHQNSWGFYTCPIPSNNIYQETENKSVDSAISIPYAQAEWTGDYASDAAEIAASEEPVSRTFDYVYYKDITKEEYLEVYHLMDKSDVTITFEN